MEGVMEWIWIGVLLFIGFTFAPFFLWLFVATFALAVSGLYIIYDYIMSNIFGK
jgi:hypothetical protein